MEEMKLKPCPFCGGEAEFVNYGADGLFDDWDVECKRCHILFVSQGAYDGAVVKKEEVATAWNRRMG